MSSGSMYIVLESTVAHSVLLRTTNQGYIVFIHHSMRDRTRLNYALAHAHGSHTSQHLCKKDNKLNVQPMFNSFTRRRRNELRKKKIELKTAEQTTSTSGKNKCKDNKNKSARFEKKKNASGKSMRDLYLSNCVNPLLL